MDNVTRIGVSLEPELLEKFDELIREKGYTTRSEAIRDLIRNALVEEIWADENSEAFGTITLVYDHEKGGVREKLLEIQHAHHTQISSSMHIHLDAHRCLEVLVVSGKVKNIKKLADELCSVRGVLHGKLAMTAGRFGTEGEEH
ncbi:MAG: nickel-responsive transcriptional regulator NikR [Methanomassiliicoccales archaeon]|jgi:CopG family nickel-responsive transcriptional regulator|nr:nickel-responsive transcriptional regulator NikR [Methanomassiliicoccales archaeon]